MEDLAYKTDKYVYNFQQFETTRYFAENSFAREITLGNTGK